MNSPLQRSNTASYSGSPQEFAQRNCLQENKPDDDFSLDSEVGIIATTGQTALVSLDLPRFSAHIDPCNMNHSKESIVSVPTMCSISEVARIQSHQEPCCISKFQKISDDSETKQFINAFHNAYLHKAATKQVEDLRQDLFCCGVYNSDARKEVLQKMVCLDRIVEHASYKTISQKNAYEQINILREDCFGLLVCVRLCNQKS